MKCPSCGYENSEDARYCSLCQHSFVKAESELRGLREPSAPYGLAPLAEPRREGVPAARTVLRGGATGENWFQRHLNWTWLFAGWAVILLHIIGGVVYAVFVTHSIINSSISFVTFAMSVVAIQIIFLVLYTLANFGVGAWVLKRKNRSLLWLLMFLPPYPLYWVSEWLGALATLTVAIWFLCLRNYSDLVVMPEPPSSSIQPGLAPQGLGSRSDKYGP
jgi:uncharacterized membrane protein YhaH (DUF805 family)